MRTILISLCLAAVLFAVGGAPSVAFASPQSINYVPLAPIDVEGSEFKTGVVCQAPTCFPRYLRTIYNVGIALAGLFAVVSIVRGGFQLMFTDSILGHSEGKGIILRALGGLLIVYSSYILMNTINPALGRDLDLALQFERVKPTPTPPPLTVVEMSEYQQGLLRDARVRNDAWRTTEEARLTQEIEALKTELDAEQAKTDPDGEVIAILRGNINIKTADLETLRREGVVKKVEYEAQKAANVPTITDEQLKKLINEITVEGAGSTPSGIARVHAAFDAMVNNQALGLTTEQKARLRASEAERVASLHHLLADGIIAKLSSGVWTTGRAELELLRDQIVAIDAARQTAIAQLGVLETGATNETNAAIQHQKSVVWNQSCKSISNLYYKCVDKRFAGGSCNIAVPLDLQRQCTANSLVEF